jgi:hypothetical protein
MAVAARVSTATMEATAAVEAAPAVETTAVSAAPAPTMSRRGGSVSYAAKGHAARQDRNGDVFRESGNHVSTSDNKLNVNRHPKLR